MKKNHFSLLILMIICLSIQSLYAQGSQCRPNKSFSEVLLRKGQKTENIKNFDLNQDGFQDLILLNPLAQSIDLLFGTATEEFTGHQTLSIGSTTDLAVADLDQDQTLDLAFLMGDQIAIYLGLGQNQWLWESPIMIPADGAKHIYLKDVNQDELPDLIYAQFDQNSSFLCNQIKLAIPNSPDFYDSTPKTNVDCLNDVAGPIYIDDFDQDGLIELYHLSAKLKTTLDASGMIQSSEDLDFPEFESIKKISIQDIDFDGYLDFVILGMIRLNIGQAGQEAKLGMVSYLNNGTNQLNPPCNPNFLNPNIDPKKEMILVDFFMDQQFDLISFDSCATCPTQLNLSLQNHQNTQGIKLIAVPTGSYLMGNASVTTESPVQEITLKRFLMSQTEITVAQYRQCMIERGCSAPPSPIRLAKCNIHSPNRDNFPMNCISWTQANMFVEWLNRKSSLYRYALPSESQWEYVAKNLTNTNYAWGNDLPTCQYGVLKLSTCSPVISSPVCSLSALNTSRTNLNVHGDSALGFCDLTGNVAEWVKDAFVKSYKFTPLDGTSYDNRLITQRIFRGGAFNLPVAYARSTTRYAAPMTYQNANIGFRVIAIETCGNGQIEGLEKCDDGNRVSNDGCSSSCEKECGNGFIDILAGESCDDLNMVDGDGCDQTCHAEICGNGVLQVGEQCDDGNVADGDGCNQNCIKEICGNGIIEIGEVCDNGNLNSDVNADACRTNCQLPKCGDGAVDSNEMCDQGDQNQNAADACRVDCQSPKCGDGIIDSNETCDEALNNDDFLIDACRTNCQIAHCGDSVLDSNENCDDGILNSNTNADACRTNCQLPFCGDGVVDQGEVCDQAQNNSDVQADACRTNCQPSTCGDGVKDTGETCDPGLAQLSDILANACRSTCQLPKCGDNVIDAGELCDDGNQISGDGCDQVCISEVCGNGIVQAGEACDDGNQSNTDACLDGVGGGCKIASCGDLFVYQGVEQCDTKINTNTCNNNCTTAVCGDGFHNPATGEQCDSFGVNSIDCNADCTLAICGDGIINDQTVPMEECDDMGETNTCDTDCTVATCGDGTLNLAANEQCDDMGESVGCNADCTNAVCGDGVLNLTAGEACDDGNVNNQDACKNDCSLATCGDGVINLLSETCDDGNVDNTDLCPDGIGGTCQIATCGDGFVLFGIESCDDGNTNDQDACRNTCVNAACGDGVVHVGVETCDDGNIDNTDNCPDGVTGTCQTATCGDGFINAIAGETCDDANLISTDACTALCQPAVCGDGFIQAGETCDDGNLNANDHCTATCQTAVCGDGLVNLNVEACDDGNAIDTDACTSVCQLATCGDGFVQAAEICDDGNTSNIDACTNACQLAACGDGFVQAGESCDDGNSTNTDACLDDALNGGTCIVATCGDGFVLIGTEDCDDGNLDNTSDACTTLCKAPSCGDGFVQAGEVCDDGNSSNVDACTNTCQPASCGDGFVQAGEACDDANLLDTDSCTAVCQLAICGDGLVNAGVEACDDGNAIDTDACTSVCNLAVCGDGFIQAGEVCDDGNKSDTDACLDGNSGLCQLASCGDGYTHSGVEACDDANAIETDACLSTCVAPSCGDGFIRAGIEECDLGIATNSDTGACTNACLLARCGDGFVRAGVEACDDQNQSNNDACTNGCKLAMCGDGFVQVGVEACDDKNAINTDACIACQVATCGDGFIQAGVEACDDANPFNNDACVACQNARCGDGFVRPGFETCDDGNVNQTDACLNTCQPATCGDGFVQVGIETCDDANAINTDACIACQVATCGDGFVQAGIEACDDGNTTNTDLCTNACKVAICGDGIISNTEGCDDGTKSDLDACLDGASQLCQTATCGDGFVRTGVEQCDDANVINTDTCTNLCKTPICGDGFVQGAEECDDGNPINTDLCSNTCRNARCGDSVVQVGETCDDGNVVGGDGCRMNCQVEAHPYPIIFQEINAGSYLRGSAGVTNQRPVVLVNVPRFLMSRTETTVAQYKACVDAGGCTPPSAGAGCNWNVVGKEGHPVNCITWIQAKKYIAWLDTQMPASYTVRLPSEAEWEYAARSRANFIRYAWSDILNPTCNDFHFQNSMGAGCGTNSSARVCSHSYTGSTMFAPPTNSDSQQGICDLNGNMAEWTEDAYLSTYTSTPTDGSANQPVNNNLLKVYRGGSWKHSLSNATSTYRFSLSQGIQTNYVGLRPVVTCFSNVELCATPIDDDCDGIVNEAGCQ